MNNLYKEQYTIKKLELDHSGNKNNLIEGVKSKLKERLCNFINHNNPINVTTLDNGDIKLDRTLFVFTQEELIQFVNSMKSNKGNTDKYYEV